MLLFYFLFILLYQSSNAILLKDDEYDLNLFDSRMMNMKPSNIKEYLMYLDPNDVDLKLNHAHHLDRNDLNEKQKVYIMIDLLSQLLELPNINNLINTMKYGHMDSLKSIEQEINLRYTSQGDFPNSLELGDYNKRLSQLDLSWIDSRKNEIKRYSLMLNLVKKTIQEERKVDKICSFIKDKYKIDIIKAIDAINLEMNALLSNAELKDLMEKLPRIKPIVDIFN